MNHYTTGLRDATWYRLSGTWKQGNASSWQRRELILDREPDEIDRAGTPGHLRAENYDTDVDALTGPDTDGELSLIRDYMRRVRRPVAERFESEARPVADGIRAADTPIDSNGLDTDDDPWDNG